MRVFCRLSWEEESNVSTGDDNSPAGKCECFFFTYKITGSFNVSNLTSFYFLASVWKFGSHKTKEKEEDKTQKTTKMRRGTIEGSLRRKKSTMKFV